MTIDDVDFIRIEPGAHQAYAIRALDPCGDADQQRAARSVLGHDGTHADQHAVQESLAGLDCGYRMQ